MTRKRALTSSKPEKAVEASLALAERPETKKFDLNIEKVLEDWEVSHALREIIANAIDERLLTKTGHVRIFKDKERKWHVRDFGRGLRYEHLTQNENAEKLANGNVVIGKFGVGLKDALATLNRHNVEVLIRSKHGDIGLEKSPKHGFEDVFTLHAMISEPSDPRIKGTEFVLRGVKDEDIEEAKDFFLIFSGETLLEQTKFGQVLKSNGVSRVYINGVVAAEEEDFLFSYNITSLTLTMRKALNRERSHVGRTAYQDRVKSMLLECQDGKVAQRLAADLKEVDNGTSCDEVKWNDVAVHACRLLATSDKKIIFVTSLEQSLAPGLVDKAKQDGYTVIFIPGVIKDKIRGLKDLAGKPVRDLDEYVREWSDSFQYAFVNRNELSEPEKAVFDKMDQIFELVGGKPARIRDIFISETMRLEGYSEAAGVWERSARRIVVKRSQLRDLRIFAGTLLHETAHAESGAGDISGEFERGLSELLGRMAANVLK